MTELQDSEIIIIGGGIVGCSIAYQLSRMGKKNEPFVSNFLLYAQHNVVVVIQ